MIKETSFPHRAAGIAGSIAYGGTIVLIFLAAIPFGTVEPWHKGLVVVAVSCLGLLRVADGLFRGSFRLAEPMLLLPLTGIIGLALVQLIPVADGRPSTLDPYATRSFILVFASLLICAEILFHYTRGERQLRHLVALVLTVAIGSSLFGLVRSVVSGIEPGLLSSYSQPEQSYAQFLNRNHFALLAEMGFGLLTGIILKAGVRARVLFVLLTAAGVLIYSIIASNSRGGLVSLAGMAILAVFVHIITRSDTETSSVGVRIRRRQGKTKKLLVKIATASAICVVILGMIVTLVVFIGGEAVVTRIEQIDVEVGSLEQSRINRASIWASTAEMIKERPLIGSGFGAYPVAITRFDTSTGRFSLEQAHNDYLEVVANGGVVAAVLMAAFGVLVGIRLFRNMRSPDRYRRASCFGACIGITGVMIHSFVDFGLHVLVNAMLLVVLIVIGTATIDDTGGAN